MTFSFEFVVVANIGGGAVRPGQDRALGMLQDLCPSLLRDQTQGVAADASGLEAERQGLLGALEE
eukprot:CAMPEP_0204011532 /NCGR_PEP_ID=MMETSP0360-20130528/23348_1 /ASSEMBLY_ACC=CAM_ASM_000342 /TAXON_ID=268821 /ORGANISM="Scrippsiella Hangoei, Strain SHTV-5" /LENGTH=64 /DNA_ID=CAMNT_0050954119 /DNA_START=217 /DNA_END=407 /DNA_ORIENTATION=-